MSNTESTELSAAGAVASFTSRRQGLLDDRRLVGRAFTEALTAAADDFMSGLFKAACAEVGTDGRSAGSGLALVAVGGYGRGEQCPGSDFDVLLLHDSGRKIRADVEPLAHALWYPVWDTGAKLGHAVRTVKEATALATGDLDTATALLSCRHLAGDPLLTEALLDVTKRQWRKKAKKWLARLDEAVMARHREMGEVAFLLEPDLKEARGGLRDGHAIGWLHEAVEVIEPAGVPALREAYETVLAARVELHRLRGRSGPSSDVLLLQDQDGVAVALGQPSADELMRRIADAARTIAWTSDETWRAARIATGGGQTDRQPPHDVAMSVRVAGGEVTLADGADPGGDPALVLRLAAAAAEEEAPIAHLALARLKREAPPLTGQWPAEARQQLVALLGAGRAAIPVFETLDRYHLLAKVLPEWEPCRSKPQRNAYHRFTVDRHLCEAAAEAASLTRSVSRPDLLLVGTWLHDIGKGYPGDHTEVGVELIDAIGHRIGFDDDDVDVLVAMCRHHLLLPDVATRRDLDDDDTIRRVAEAVGSPLVLELLDALTQADSIATGPAAWSRWKAGLVRQLVSRVSHVLGGGTVADVTADSPLTPELEALVAARAFAVQADGEELSVVAPDRPGLLSRVAGVLSLYGLDVVAASAWSGEGMAVETYRVTPWFGEMPDWAAVSHDLEQAVLGRLALDARLAQRERTYARRGPYRAAAKADPFVLVDNDSTDAATVVEVRAPDSVGLLFRVARALADLDLDIASAKVQTLGHEVIDTFYLRDRDGSKVTDARDLAEIRTALRHAAMPPTT